MIEFLRAIKLGAVNLFGVAIPGFLLLSFSIAGVAAPAIVFAIGIFHISSFPAELLGENKLEAIVVVVVFSYVAGFILRLSSPDGLDRISAEKVREYQSKSENECWPYTGKDDKYPYNNFWRYLKERKLDKLCKLVTWGNATDEKGTVIDLGKRSKTAVAQMKLKVLVSCPDLFAMIESNEAHVRLEHFRNYCRRSMQWLNHAFALSGVIS
jgi:hypothetical protein